jgi:hypothetical protein
MAREMARRLRCTYLDSDSFHPAVTDDDFIQARKRLFADALRIDEMRRAVETGGPLVLLSGICARQVIARLQLPAAAFVWIQHASLTRMEQMCRDFLDYDEDAGVPINKHSIHQDVQAYIDSNDDPRRQADVIYMNAWGDREP